MSTASSPARANASAALARHAAALDAFVVHLNKCMETPAGIDAVLAAVCYGARLAAVVLNTAAGRALLHEPARQLAAVLLALPTRASGLVLLTGTATATATTTTTKKAAKAAAAASALVLAKRLRALGSLMTEARMMLRLWGLLSMYVWARQMVKQLWASRQPAAAAAAPKESAEGEATTETAVAPTTASSRRSALETIVGWTQLASCIAYQVPENWAYLSSKGVLGATPAQQGRLYMWSSRAFAVFVAAELGSLGVKIARQATETPAQKAEALELHRNLVRYASLAPVMTHWSLEKGFLGETALTVLGFIPAALQMHKTWTET